MKVNKKFLKLTLVILILVISAGIANPMATGQMTEDVIQQKEAQVHYYRLDKDFNIGIIYDQKDDLSKGNAESIYRSLSLMTPNVKLIPVTSYTELKYELESQELEIGIYVFSSDYNNFYFTGEYDQTGINWDAIANLLSSKTEMHHILAMGNSKQFLQAANYPPNIHGTESQVEDAKSLYIYALWALADVLETHYSDDLSATGLAEDVRMATLQFFANNLNDLVSRNLKPEHPMGVEDPAVKEARKEKFMEEHPAKVERIPQKGYVVDPESNRVVDPQTGDPAPYTMDIFSLDQVTAGDFILNLLPDTGGLRGPIGGIIDELLGWLLSELGDVIGLSEGTLNSIVNVLLGIPDFIGALADPSASKIKEFLNNVKPLIPLPEDMMQYFDLLVDGLFLLRGDADDIKGFIETAIGLILPDTGLGESLVSVISQVFSTGFSVIDGLASGDNFMEVIFSVLNEDIVSELLNDFLNSTVGITGDQLTDAIDMVQSTVSTLINTISSGDFTKLVTEYGPDMLNMIPGLDGAIGSEGMEIIMLASSVLLIASGVVEDITLDEVLTELIEKTLLTELDESGVNVDLIEEKVKEILKQVGKWLEDPSSLSFGDIQSFVSGILGELGVSTSQFNDAFDGVEKLIALIVSIKSDFDIGSATDIISVVTDLLSQFGLADSNIENTVEELIGIIMTVVNFVESPPDFGEILSGDFSSLSNLKETIEELITFIVESVPSLSSSFATNNVVVGQALTTNDLTGDAGQLVSLISEAIALVVDVVGNAGENSLEGILLTLLQAGGFAISQIDGFGDITQYIELAKGLFGTLLGYFDEAPSLEDVLNDVLAFVPASFQDTAEDLIEVIMSLREIFTGGFKAVFGKLTEWIAGQVTQLVTSLTSGISGALGEESWTLLDLSFPIEIGPISLFEIGLKLGLKPGFEFNAEKFGEVIYDLVFKGISLFDGDMEFGDILREALSFINIYPIFTAEISLSDFGSGESSFISFLLETLGVQLSFSGSGFFEMSLFSFKNGVFSWDDFFKIIGWGFKFEITISKTLTLLDFLTGGAGGSLNAIGKYIGLDAISITIAFTIALEIIKRAATANKPETGSLTITLGIAFTVSLGIDILIAKLVLTGTLEIVLTFLQDLVEPVPMRVFISIELIITVTIGFLFWDWDFDYHWSPSGFEPPMGKELTSNSPDRDIDSHQLGGDSDNDGLSDKYELNTPGLSPDTEDSDGDGLSDKFETQTLNTDPADKDTDNDGLFDNIEYDIKTNPLAADSDFDGLNDYEETMTIGTDPLAYDTDEDGLDDYYEVHHSYNMTGPYFNVKSVEIGGKTYTDHTDPLNPDTDGDGLLDGNEGERGIYYGPALHNMTKNEEAEDSEPITYEPDGALIFNGGYTHPLSNDTDGDSYEQIYSGEISPRKRFLRDMSDYTEIHGIEVIYIDPETGEPETPVIVRTNPVNPDTDGDTGIDPDQRENPPFGFFINSDGYELALDPPTDPLDGDTDDDGLIDGYEGILRPDANHTDANNPDTDGDGLGDLQEFQLQSDPRSVDTDRDGVTDGDEFFIYGTSPFLADSDSDGLEDGEELFVYHSSPFLRDTDRDGLSDFDEVWKHFSDPADEDSDNDGLTDYEEIYVHYTDPFETDTDGDGLFDGDEVLGLNYTVLDGNGTEQIVTVYTDPTKADTDGDSLMTIDQDGEISQRMNDGDEWKLGTRPDRVDTDEDGIPDGWELWLGKGKIPDFEPIQLDPLNPDTDGDTFRDGSELHIANRSTLLNPYIGFYPQYPLNTSPVNNDTDGDLITDDEEIRLYFTNPSNNDTDNDTLSDYEEIMIRNTKPHKNDTDGDGIIDPVEIFGYYFPEGHRSFDNNATLILTDPTNSDSDGDLIPDGAEIHRYGWDPRNDDEDNNGIIDGMEVDSDGDGLMDGEEFYIYLTTEAAEGGGAFQPDSDRDGLFDGQEVYETNTDPGLWDTDNDTFSDGLEVTCGTNPNDNSTTLSDFESCFDKLSRLVVMSPVPYKKYSTNNVPIIAFDPDDNITAIEFRYKELNSSSWSSTQSMIKDTDRGTGYWKSSDSFQFPLVNGTIQLELNAFRNDGETITRNIKFYLQVEPHRFEITSPKEGKTYEFDEFSDPILPITVEAGSEINSTWFRMFNGSGGIITDNKTLKYEGGRNAYHLSEYEFPDVQGKQNYTLQVFAQKTSGSIVSKSIVFYVKTPTTAETILKYGGGAAAVGGVAVTASIIRRRGFKNPFSKGGNN